MTKTVALPASPSGAMRPTAIPLRLCRGKRADLNAGRDDPSFDIAPKCNQQFAGHCHNCDPPGAPGQCADALAKPLSQIAARLVAQPEPGELDHRRPGTRIAGSADATITVDAAALIWHRRDADVAGELPAIIERTVEYLACEPRGKVIADTPDAAQSANLAVGLLLRLSLDGYVPLGLNLAD